jgi:hypothetical protein
MPLARITAPIADFYDRLAQDLRAQGFDVQNAHPGQFFSEAADLEISVRHCAPEDAVRLAADASVSKDMCVLVTPNGRDGIVRSIEMIVVQPRTQVQPQPAGITPAQVIEITSALARTAEGKPPLRIPHNSIQPTAWQRANKSARSSWVDITNTTVRWLETINATCQSRWQAIKQACLPVRAFFWEVGDETKQQYHRIADALIPHRKSGPDEEEQLVPSMFHLSEPEDIVDEKNPDMFEHQVIVQMPEPPLSGRVGRDPRFLKAAVAAAVVAIAVVLSVSALHRAPQRPAATNDHEVDPKAVVPASLTLKPSAMIERGGEHRASGVQMVSARQVAHEESGVDDTVIRYGRRAPAPRRANNPYEIKHYSDLD